MTGTVRVRARQFLPAVQLAALVEWTGTGLFLAVSTIYFVRIVGLSATSVGLGLGLAGGVAMGVSPVVAHAADRFGPRRVLVVLSVVRAGATLGYLWVDDWLGFALVALVLAVNEQASPPLIQAYVGARAEPDLRGRVLAVQRTLVNTGISVGGLIAGAVLGSSTRGSFQWLLVGGAAAYLLVAAVFAASTSTEVPERNAGGLRRVLAGRGFLALTGYNALLSLWTPILNVALPLWLVTRTHVPVRYVGVLYAVNTVLCIALQYPMNRFSATVPRALRSYSASAALLVCSTLGLAAAPRAAGGAALPLLAGSVVLLTFAELLQVGAAWTLSFASAPEDSRSTYLVLFGMGRTLANRVIGPMLMTGVVLALGTAGWAALACVFAVAAVLPVRLGRYLAAAAPVPTDTDAEAGERVAG